MIQIYRLANLFIVSILIFLSFLYYVLIFIRNRLFDFKFFKARKLEAIVISIGNISTGGTGKTPIVIYVSNYLKELGYNVGVVSRGYKRKTRGLFLVSNGEGPIHSWEKSGDECYMMSKILKGIPIVVDKSRYRGGKFLIKNFGVDIIILDDGFQHRNLHRDIDILVINAREKFLGLKMLPFGNLREPFNNIRRSDIILTSKMNPDKYLNNQLKEISIPKFRVKANPNISINLNNRKNIHLRGKSVFAFSGIGDPGHFIETTEGMGCNVLGHKNFPDHFTYSLADIKSIKQESDKLNVDYIITTEKDWVRIAPIKPDFLIVPIGLELFVVNEKEFFKIIRKIIISEPSPKQRRHQQMLT